MNIPFDVEAAKQKIDGRPVVLSVSGGKDSTATGLVLIEAGIPFRCVHMDTGWEHEDTEHYVREVLPGILGPIEIVQGKHGGMADLCRKKGMFPSRVRRFCTQELKVRPFLRWAKAFMEEHSDEIINAVGVRNLESRARAGLEEWEWNESMDLQVWRPIISLSFEDVIAVHARHGVVPNPLYLKGSTRVGCWPCIFSRKKEIRLVADVDPGRIDRLEALEHEVWDLAAARYRKRGETFESLGYDKPCMFVNPTARRKKGETKRSGVNWPIRKVVEWARTARGGKQYDMFPDYETDGCMRWGMCDTHVEEPETHQPKPSSGSA